MENPNDNNPFAAPGSVPVGHFEDAVQRPKFPVFCLVMFITSIVFASLRLFMIPLAVIGYFALKNAGDPQIVTVPLEIITTTGIAVFGLFANGFMLARKKIGVPLAWLLVASVLGSIVVGLWQATFVAGNLDRIEPGMRDSYVIGAYVGIAFVMLFRTALLAAYCVALVRFSRWISPQR